jgi:hypothetical protein
MIVGGGINVGGAFLSTVLDWVALAPMDQVEEVVQQVFDAQDLHVQWASSTPDGIPLRAGAVKPHPEVVMATLTLQGFWPDQTHLHLLLSEDTPGELEWVQALANAFYKRFHSRGWIPMDDHPTEHIPAFLRPQGFRPRLTSVEDY